MDQIRSHILSAQLATALNRSAPTPADSGDAFAQVLDQHLARTGDDEVRTGLDNPRAGSDWRRSTDNTDRPETAGTRTSGRRRDDKAIAAASTAKPKTASKPAAVAAQASGGKGADSATAPGKTKCAPDDDQKEPAVAGQTQNDGGNTTTSTAAEDKPGAQDDPSGQQAGEGDKDQAAAPKPDDDAQTDADLTALMIPQPLQTITTTANATADASASGGTVAPAMQAALLLAGLAAGPINLTGAANVQTPAGAAGLKFGAVIPDLTAAAAKAGADASAPTTRGGDVSDPAAPASDPAAGISVSAQAPRTQGNSTGNAAKARGTATASSPVTAAYSGQSGAVTAQQAIGGGAVLPWATSNARADAAAPIAGTGDAELAGWPPYLDADLAGATSTGVSARAAAFLAQLKQNVQLPPAHEQVAIQIQKAMQNGSNRLTVNLEPAELGRVEVKLDVDKDKNVTASIVVDRPATLDLLQRDAKALERALQDAGLQTNDGSLSFSLRNGTGQGGNGGNGQAGAGIGNGKTGAQASDAASQPVRADVIDTADGYVDVET